MKLLLTSFLFLTLAACGSMEKIKPTIKRKPALVKGEPVCMNKLSEAIPCEKFTPVYETLEDGSRVPLKISF